MNSIAIGLSAFAFAFGGALFGIWFRRVLPEAHLSAESKDIVKLSIGLIATMTALLLGLVVASAKSSFDTTDAAIKNTAASLLTLDRLLARFGPETRETRDLLRRIVIGRVDSIWPEEKTAAATPDRAATMTRPIEAIEDRIQQLAPQNDQQRWLKSRALTLSNDLLQARWLLLAGATDPSVPMPFLVALIFWLTVIFGAFGLMAPRNATVTVVQLISALSVAISIFLVLELEHPFDGIIKVSSAPLRFTVSHLGE